MPQRERNWQEADSLSAKDRRWLVDPANPDCPFNRIIGNKDGLEILKTIAFKAIGRANHRCSEVPLALTGPSGVGKTHFARSLAELLDIPFAEINASEIKSSTEIFDTINDCLREFSHKRWGNKFTLELAPYQSDDPKAPEDPAGKYFYAPTMIVFTDEAHNLQRMGSVSQALLHAVERKTHKLTLADGRILDTTAILFIFATTHWGEIFPPLRKRFQQIQLEPYVKDEVADIVSLNDPNLPEYICEKIAFFTWRSVRESLRFMTLVKDQREMHECTWDEAVERTRKLLKIDSLGMTKTRLDILVALAQGPLSQRAILSIANCEERELVEELLPPLRCYGKDIQPLIRVGGRGFMLTEAGANELAQRGIEVAGSHTVVS